jgi:hypothetical protein
MKLFGKKEVFILGMKIKITYFDSSCRADNTMGRSDEKNGIISLCKDMPNDVAEQTLLHECIHLISDNVAAGLTEKQVTAISAGLYSFIKENKL